MNQIETIKYDNNFIDYMRFKDEKVMEEEY